MSPSQGGTQVRWMGRGQDMDELGQVGGHGWNGQDTWEVGEVGGMRAGGTWARHGGTVDMGEVGEVGGLCGLCRDA